MQNGSSIGDYNVSHTEPTTTSIRLQPTLVVLIHHHLLGRLAKSSLEIKSIDIRRRLLRHTMSKLPTFLNKVGYVSQHFFNCSQLALKTFFEINTFPAVSHQLSLRYVSLFVYDSFEVEHFRVHALIISRLRVRLERLEDLEFLNKSSPCFFKHLKHLDACVDPSLHQELSDALKVNDSITSIDLTDTYIDSEGAVLFADAFKVNSTITATIAFAQALKVNSSITHLDLQRTAIDIEGAVALAEALKVNSTVSVINLRFNAIDDEGAIALADALKVNSTVTRILLEDNCIGVDGGLAFAEALKENSSLTELNLWSNSIGPEGAIAFAEALKENSSLTDLNLQSNAVGTEGAIALADVLKVNSSISKIVLYANKIDSDTTDHINRISNGRIKC
ncbi:hypothetical protein GEMRC1_002408 [Eukaryota sp. GEM-RC1]